MKSCRSFECYLCGKCFSTKQNLARHINSIHAFNPECFKCNLCNRIFNRKYDLDRHKKFKHSSNRTVFECNECGKTFVAKQNLSRHATTMHAHIEIKLVKYDVDNITSEIFTTSEDDNQTRSVSSNERNPVEIKFSYQKIRKKNEIEKHAEMNEEKMINAFECGGCGRKFNRKFSLKRHLRICQNRALEQDMFKCSVCGVEYSRKNMLKQHIRRKHTDSLCVKCDVCNVKIKGRCQEKALAQHMVEFHFGNRSVGQLKCALCDYTFSKRENIWYHLIGDAHSVRIDHEHLRFATIDEFEKWKTEIEKKTTTFFRKKNTKYFAQHSACRYVCHRSGSYQPKAFDRKRRVKSQGSKKMGAFCPAELILYRRNVDGVCRVSYVSTHLGHNVCDETELAHVYLSKDEKVEIASKLNGGVPYARILAENLELADESAGVDATYLLSRRDLLNISRDFNVKRKAEKQQRVLRVAKSSTSFAHPVDLDDFVRTYEKSILFCKKPGEECRRQGGDGDSLLEKDDVFIAFMTEEQRLALSRYGNKVISLDSSASDVGNAKFCLQTMLVVDDYCDSIPVAFAVSNRRDERAVELFLSCVKDAVGPVSTATLMSDGQLTYYESWLRLMGATEHRPFCRWQTTEVWTPALRKIANPDKKRRIRDRLLDMSSKLDAEMFHADLNELLADADAELAPFLTHFRAEFCGNLESWACCYRRNTDANMVAESLSRVLKRLYGKLSKAKSLSVYLTIVRNYLKFNERDLKRKEIRGTVSVKLRELRRRHDEYVRHGVIVAVENVLDAGWYVSVTDERSDVADVHLVQECDDVCCECKLFCEQCGVCIHKYQCTCADNALKSNMCLHIHALASYLKSSATNEYEDVDAAEASGVGADDADDATRFWSITR